MALKQEELERIGEYVQSHLTEWLPEKIENSANTGFPFELTERIIRVGEELKSQRELMIMGFNQIDKRFEQVDKRFEQMQHNMDKRFEQLQASMDIQYGHIEKHFSQLQWTMGLGFTILAALMGIFNFY